jgi:cytochrome d ubiquinol oxidase subunit II
MSPADLVAAILWLSVAIYAVLGGADFGGGVWDIFSGGRNGPAQRRVIADAMGPVWEANHVWLIFLIVGLFTGFPTVFAALSVALYLPFTVALIGIVLRGAAFAFRAHGREAVGAMTGWGAVFGAASVVTPACFGAAAAAVASGAIQVRDGRVASTLTAGWTTPFAIDCALLAVSLCAYLAATYLMVETEGRTALRQAFRRRAALAALAAGALGLIGLPLARLDAPTLWSGLTGRALPLLVLALLNGPVAAWAVWRDRARLARLLVATQVTLVLLTWAVAQWPYWVVSDLTISSTAAPQSALVSLLVLIGAGSALLLPSLYLLFRVFKGRNPAGQGETSL